MKKAMLFFDRLGLGDGHLSEDPINHKPGLPLEGLDSRFGILAKDAVNIQIITTVPIQEILQAFDIYAPIALFKIALFWQVKRAGVVSRSLNVCAVSQYNDDVPFRSSAEDVAPFEIGALCGVFAPGQDGERPGLPQGGDTVPGVEIIHLNSGIKDADPNQPGAVTFGRGRDLGRIKIEVLARLVQALVIPLIVSDVGIIASRLHGVGNLLGDRFGFRSCNHPSFAVLIPCLRGDLSARLIASPAAVNVPVFIDAGTADYYSHAAHLVSVSTSGSPARLVTMDATKASAAVPKTAFQSTSVISAVTGSIATMVWHPVLIALISAALIHVMRVLLSGLVGSEDF